MRRAAPLSCLLLTAWLAACSSGGSGGDTTPGPAGGPLLQDEVVVPEPLLAVQADPDRIGDIPEIAATEWQADSGLQVAWTLGTDASDVSASLIAEEWRYMQECTGVVASPPLVVVTPGPVVPLMASDDVIRDIESRPVATANRGAVAIFQVRVGDFDGSFGNPGFHLRSIMGRHLWRSANLAVRDYPTLCARRS